MKGVSIRSRRELQRVRNDAVRFAGLTLAVDGMLALFKVAVGVFSGSHALLVGALYSVNDVLSAIAVTVSLRLGNKGPTDEYPYGYGKAEFIAAAMVSLAISIGVCLMIIFSMTDIFRGVSSPPHFIALFFAAISLVTSWSLAHRSQRYAEALRSPALATSADHHHADAHGSLLAIIGIAGAIIGFHLLDRIVAVLESIHLVALSGTLLAKSVNGLMDRALPDEDTEALTKGCGEVSGVRRVAHVRSRRVGSQTWVDVAVVVQPKLTVTEANQICASVADVIHGTVGHNVVAQVRFQGPRLAIAPPGPGGSGHG